MKKFLTGFPHSLVVEGGAIRFEVEASGAANGDTFSVDLYEHGPHAHPERHLGYWTFPLRPPQGEGIKLGVIVDLYGGFPDKVVRLGTAQGEEQPQATWFNPEFVIPPLIDMDLVLSGEEGERERVYIGCFIHDKGVLRQYYSRDEHQEAYTDETNVFLQVFHNTRIRILRRFFRRYFEGNRRVLDVGSGLSMFRCMECTWPFEITCCDLDEPALQVIEEQSEGYRCVVCDVAEFPFGDGEFDGLFAGEILEHVVDPVQALREWKRVVRPGGILVVTTPNAARLMNRVNRSRDVVNPEHISELTHKELWRLFGDEKLRVMECRGIYLELLFNYFRRGKKIDLLPIRFNAPRWSFLFHAFMWAGNLARPLAYNLVFVLKKEEV